MTETSVMKELNPFRSTFPIYFNTFQCPKVNIVEYRKALKQATLNWNTAPQHIQYSFLYSLE